jgi:hypothetical protein
MYYNQRGAIPTQPQPPQGATTMTKQKQQAIACVIAASVAEKILFKNWASVEILAQAREVTRLAVEHYATIEANEMKQGEIL